MSKKILVTLTNRKAILSCGDGNLYAGLESILKYRQPGWEYTPQGRAWLNTKDTEDPQGWDGYKSLMVGNKVGSGVFLALRELLETELRVKFIVEDKRKPIKFGTSKEKQSEKKSRGYQIDCHNAMVASTSGGLILNATGTGKTYIAGKYFRDVQGPVLFLVDELTLLKQAIKEIGEVTKEDIGEIGNSIFRPRRITVATIQTVHRHRFDAEYVPWTKTLQVIIIDEVHLALNRRNFQTIAAIQPPVIFGLTATLELKKKHIAYRAYDLCGPVLFDYPLERGVKEGFLSRGIAVSIQLSQTSKLPPLRGNPRWHWMRLKFMKNYQELYRELIVEGRERNRFIRKLIERAYERGKHTIVLLERVQHLKEMSEKLKVPHDLVFGEKRVEERVDSKNRFDAGKLKVILTNKVFKKGVDIKIVDMIVDGAGMKSRNDTIQKYGRGVRMHVGKKGLMYFDIADIDNKFEKAGKKRRKALRDIGVTVYKVSAELGVDKILDLAEKKLAKEMEKDSGTISGKPAA